MSKKSQPPKKNPPSLANEDSLFEQAMLEQNESLGQEDELFENTMNDPAHTISNRVAEEAQLKDDDQLFAQAMDDPTAMEPHPDNPHYTPEALPPGLTTAGLLKRCRKGLVEPEITLDLHGMKQAEAKTFLHRKLQEAHRNAKRVVLVITGRGLHSKGRAILRDQVPVWLRNENNDYVEGFEKAPRAMGGEGALLVIIRRGAPSIQS